MPSPTSAHSSGQNVSVLKSPSPFDNDICYLTDQRNYSSDPNASARITSKATLSLFDGAAKLVSSSGETGITSAVTCSTGAQFCTDKAGTENLKWGQLSEVGSTITLSIDAAGANPCIVPGFVVPSIRYKGQFRVDTSTGKLAFEGDVSQFPSIEAFVVYQKGTPMVLFQEPAIGTVKNIGDTRHLKKEIGLPIVDGKWRSADSSKRFIVEITGDSYTFTETSASANLVRQGKLQVAADGRLMIYRENDAEALKFLNFSPSIIQQIQSRSSQPSYLTFKRMGPMLRASWAGIEVIKDVKGQFKELKQPGQGPIKQYDFAK